MASPAQQCFGPRPLTGCDVITPQNMGAGVKQLSHCAFTSSLTVGSVSFVQDPTAYSGFFGLRPFSVGAITISAD